MPAQKGQAIVLLALMMAVLVGFVALAIDSARAFDSRRILQDSVDAAALAAADSYQSGAGWGGAQAIAMTLFERDSRIYGGDNCPAGGFAAPAFGTPVMTTCTVGGGSGYTVQITAADNGAAGQTFQLLATRSLPVALMQVLTGAASIQVRATATAVANDQSQTPALGGLSTDNTCPGGAGAVPAIHIENKTNPMTVLGDVVSNGSLNMGGLSYLQLAGNALTRCAAPINPDHITYQCWQRSEPPPPACPPGEPAGSLSSTANRLADPGYALAPTTGGPRGPVGSTVELLPGAYTANPNFGACYFLAAGVYEWQGGLTVNGGLISNELKPPSEPGTQFWASAHCAGAAYFVPQAGPNALPTGTYGAVVTSVRSDNGYTRESAPSLCTTVTVNSGQVVKLTISNVPGASIVPGVASYRLYATAVGGNCATPMAQFNLVAGTISAGPMTNTDVSDCPTVSDFSRCTLGHVITTYDSTTSTNPAIHPPTAAGVAPFASGRPGQSPARAAPPGGDLANENLCTNSGTAAACPLPGAKAANTTYVTPGAVLMKVTQGACINVLNGDAFLFSGYQYNWIVNHVPVPVVGSPCADNTWDGAFNSAAIGLSYAPGSAFTINGDISTDQTTGAFEGPMGGILAATIHINHSTGLVIDFDPHYAPGPGGARLIS
ncbi:MAG: pilus assembly protein TadG-related protein [Candidatus Dormibacteraeota bacterium]|nr:pilus assembly protein TadG-related protein [Candidatus Dormibacteraeota bacterium]